MKLIQGAICLPLAWPYVAVIMGLWLVLFSERPSSTSRVVRQQIEKTVFKLFNLYYIIFGVGGGGGGGIKHYQEIMRGAELILLLRTGEHYIIISPLKLISQHRFWWLLHSPSPGSDCVVFFALIGRQRSWPHRMNRPFYYLYKK